MDRYVRHLSTNPCNVSFVLTRAAARTYNVGSAIHGSMAFGHDNLNLTTLNYLPITAIVAALPVQEKEFIVPPLPLAYSYRTRHLTGVVVLEVSLDGIVFRPRLSTSIHRLDYSQKTALNLYF